jgi:hypothetical protein
MAYPNLVPGMDPRKFLGTDGFIDAMASQASASARALNLTIYFTAVYRELLTQPRSPF